MRTGIMGGTFNPPHNAHLIIAQLAYEEYALDRVIFITSGNPPHKKTMLDARHRFNMTHLAIEDNSNFTEDDFELRRAEKSYTVHTLEYLKKKYPSDELFFIIGEDSLCDLSKWYKPQEILNKANILVFPRKSRRSLKDAINAARERFSGVISAIDAPVMEISSTDIRNRIKNGKTARYMLPDKVMRYIEENNLYGIGN